MPPSKMWQESDGKTSARQGQGGRGEGKVGAASWWGETAQESRGIRVCIADNNNNTAVLNAFFTRKMYLGPLARCVHEVGA